MYCFLPLSPRCTLVRAEETSVTSVRISTQPVALFPLLWARRDQGLPASLE